MFTVTHLRRRKRERRGNVLVLMAVAMVPLCGIVALAVDWGTICVTKAELQRTADSAAMAGVWELVNATAPDSPLTALAAEENARAAAAEYGAMNTAFGKTLQLESGDIQVGYLANPLVPGGQLDTSAPDRFNAVRVRVRRDSDSNGSLQLFFAKVLGIDSADVEATATAVFISDVAGFEAPLDGQRIPLLPFALDVETWNSAENGAGPDHWTWNPDTEKFEPGADGIPEFNLYPQDTGSTANRGTVNIGASENSTSHVADQILNGVSSDDLAYHGGDLTLNENLELFLEGDPGISAGFQDELAAIRGEGRVVTVFSDMQGNGNNGVYAITKWAGICIVEVDLTGSDKRVIAQAAKVSSGGIIPGTGDTSSFVFSRVWLTR